MWAISGDRKETLRVSRIASICSLFSMEMAVLPIYSSVFEGEEKGICSKPFSRYSCRSLMTELVLKSLYLNWRHQQSRPTLKNTSSLPEVFWGDESGESAEREHCGTATSQECQARTRQTSQRRTSGQMPVQYTDLSWDLLDPNGKEWCWGTPSQWELHPQMWMSAGSEVWVPGRRRPRDQLRQYPRNASKGIKKKTNKTTHWAPTEASYPGQGKDVLLLVHSLEGNFCNCELGSPNSST